MTEGLLKETAAQALAESQAVVDLLGLLINYAERTSQVFSNGTYVIYDVIDGHSRCMFDLLRRHPGTYSRMSSHLHDIPTGSNTPQPYCCRAQSVLLSSAVCMWRLLMAVGVLCVRRMAGQPLQFGIDIPDTQWICNGHEVTARTILFCCVHLGGAKGASHLFFKPEAHGITGPGAAISHGIDYIKTRPVFGKMFSEDYEVPPPSSFP